MYAIIYIEVAKVFRVQAYVYMYVSVRPYLGSSNQLYAGIFYQ